MPVTSCHDVASVVTSLSIPTSPSQQAVAAAARVPCAASTRLATCAQASVWPARHCVQKQCSSVCASPMLARLAGARDTCRCAEGSTPPLKMATALTPASRPLCASTRRLPTRCATLPRVAAAVKITAVHTGGASTACTRRGAPCGRSHSAPLAAAAALGAFARLLRPEAGRCGCPSASLWAPLLHERTCLPLCR